MSSDKFEAVIGIEIHAQIKTASKMFCSCSTDSFTAEPNINTCPVCMGFPGQLPVINNVAVEKGCVAALALHCTVPTFSKFDRKNYFYPDLPKGYQISQFDEPLALQGWVEIEAAGTKKKINITRLHLEDDAGKLTHVPNGTLCDYNRSGIPLMEIVSEPDMRSPAEAGAYAKSIQTILRYVGASDADMEKGMMRFDASVSIRPKGEDKLYARAEIKNLNSFRSLEAAIEYEIERQISLWEDGTPQSGDITVGWTDEKQKTYFLRNKEGADDYRYFPEPDLPPLVIEPDFIDKIRDELPELPSEKKGRYVSELGLSEADADLISADPALSTMFETVVAATNDVKRAVAFLVTILIAYLNKEGMTLADLKFNADDLSDLIKMINEGKISMNQAKGEVFEEMFSSGKKPVDVVREKGLEQVSNEGELKSVCEEVLRENAPVIEDYKNGKEQAFGFLVGQVMKKTKGQANPQMVNTIIKDLIK